GITWVICWFLLFIAYIDSSVPLQGAINFNLGYGLIGITATLIGLRITHVDLPRTYVLILYAAWGITAIGLTLLTYGNASSVSNNVFYLPSFEGVVFGLVLTWLLVRTIRGLKVEDGMMMGFAWFIAMIFPLIFLQLKIVTQSNDGVIWLLSSTPLAPFIGGAL